MTALDRDSRAAPGREPAHGAVRSQPVRPQGLGATPALGAQVWVEPTTGVADLVAWVEAAHAGGLSAIRLMLLWPLIEPRPGEFRFEAFDAVMDACAERGVGVWVTLSPESRPWHRGMPGLMQSAQEHLPSTASEREWVEPFIVRCVEHYRHHPALRRWIAWNEPQRPGPDKTRRDFADEEERSLWIAVLKEMYADIAELNAEWLTGFPAFGEVPHPTLVLQPGRSREPFAGFGIWLAECRLRARCLAAEVSWVRDLVRANDPEHPVVINLPGIFDNLAKTGYDLARLASSSDILGASIHAPWHLGFASRVDHPAYIAAGIGLLRSVAPQKGVELTEVQGGGVVAGAPDACDTEPAHLAGSLLAAVASGADAGITWALNARPSGFEAGDWGMVNDDVADSDMLAMTARLGSCLATLQEEIGAWTPKLAQGAVLVDERSMAVELVRALSSADAWGSDPHRGVRAAASVVVAGLRRGHAVQLVTPSALEAMTSLSTVVVPRALGLGEEGLGALEAFMARGGRVILDPESLRLDDHARVRSGEDFAGRHGYRMARLHQPRDPAVPSAATSVRWRGMEVGHAPGPRAAYRFTASDWRTSTEWTVGTERGAVIHERTHESLTLLGCPLDARADGAVALAQDVWDRYLPSPEVVPLDGASAVLPVVGEERQAWVVVGPTLTERGGTTLTLTVAPGLWRDLWTGRTHHVAVGGALSLLAVDGIAVLVCDSHPSATSKER